MTAETVHAAPAFLPRVKGGTAASHRVRGEGQRPAQPRGQRQGVLGQLHQLAHRQVCGQYDALYSAVGSPLGKQHVDFALPTRSVAIGESIGVRDRQRVAHQLGTLGDGVAPRAQRVGRRRLAPRFGFQRVRLTLGRGCGPLVDQTVFNVANLQQERRGRPGRAAGLAPMVATGQQGLLCTGQCYIHQPAFLRQPAGVEGLLVIRDGHGELLLISTSRQHQVRQVSPVAPQRYRQLGDRPQPRRALLGCREHSIDQLRNGHQLPFQAFGCNSVYRTVC